MRSHWIAVARLTSTMAFKALGQIRGPLFLGDAERAHLRRRKRLDRPFDVLEPQTAEFLEARIYAPDHGLVDRARDQDSARRHLGFQARRDVHPVAEQIVALNNQIAEMQPRAEQNDMVLGLAAAMVENRLVEFNHGRQCLDGAGEFDQDTVTRQLDDAPATPRQTGMRCCWRMVRNRPTVPLSSRPLSRE